MTPKERDITACLVTGALISIVTGLWPYYDKAYYLGIQAIHILFLLAVRIGTTHRTIRIITAALIFLSIGEAVDEIIGNNLSFRINDYVLLLTTIIVAYKLIKNGRYKA